MKIYSVIINKLDQQGVIDVFEPSLGVRAIELTDNFSGDITDIARGVAKQIVSNYGQYVYGYYVTLFCGADITYHPVMCVFNILSDGQMQLL